MPFVEGESAARPAPARAAAPGGGRAPHRAGGGAGAAVRPRATASSTATSSRRTCSSPTTATRWSPTSASRGRWRAAERAADRDRLAVGHAGLHEPGAGGGRQGRSTPAPTSTRLAAVLYEMLAGEPPSPGRRPQAMLVRAPHRAGAERAGGAAIVPEARGPGDPEGALAGARPTGSGAWPSSGRRSRRRRRRARPPRSRTAVGDRRTAAPPPRTRAAFRRVPARRGDPGARPPASASACSSPGADRTATRPRGARLAGRAAVRERGRLGRGVLRGRHHRRGAREADRPAGTRGDRAAAAPVQYKHTDKDLAQIARGAGCDPPGDRRRCAGPRRRTAAGGCR